MDNTKYRPSFGRFIISLLWSILALFLDLSFEMRAIREEKEGKDYSVFVGIFWMIYHVDGALVWNHLCDVTGIDHKTPTVIFMTKPVTVKQRVLRLLGTG